MPAVWLWGDGEPSPHFQSDDFIKYSYCDPTDLFIVLLVGPMLRRNVHMHVDSQEHIMNTCALGIAIFCSYTSPTSLYLNDALYY